MQMALVHVGCERVSECSKGPSYKDSQLINNYPCFPKLHASCPSKTFNKNGFDCNAVNSYRPFSRLTFLSKIAERAIALRLRKYLFNNNFNSSSFRSLVDYAKCSHNSCGFTNRMKQHSISVQPLPIDQSSLGVPNRSQKLLLALLSESLRHASHPLTTSKNGL